MPQPQRRHEQELHELQLSVLPEQPQEPVLVPPTEPELQPQRRQPQELFEFEELPVFVPPTEPVLPLLQVHVHVQRFEVLESLVPPTEPEFEFWQQGLQQELATKLGNTMPP